MSDSVLITKLEIKKRISDKIKGLLLQRTNPLRIKINDPQISFSFKFN